MKPRANWKGTLKISELVCPVALYSATSSSDRIALNVVNRATGNRVRREYVDSDTGAVVDTKDQVKGFDTGDNDLMIFQPDEIESLVPESDKTLNVDAFVKCDTIDQIYFDKSYYLAPSDAVAHDAFALICKGLKEKKVAAIAQTVLFRRLRTVLIRPDENGLVATTLNFDYEVRPAADVFSDVGKHKIDAEMLDLAKHIIKTKMGTFDPTKFADRYDEALKELVQAKIEGRKIGPLKKRPAAKVVDLMTALRESAKATSKSARAPKTVSGTSRRKAS